jgi:sugar lactone lactonase YvrE
MILDIKAIILIAVITTISIVLYSPIAAHSFVNNQKASTVIGQKDFTSGSPNGGALLPSKTSLHHPVGITFDSKGNLWVADFFNNRVLEFPASTSKNVSSIAAADKVIGQTKFESKSVNAGGVSSSSLFYPADVAFDLNGNLWVADSSNNRILKYTPPFKNGQAASIVIGQEDFKSRTPNKGTITPTPDSLNLPYAIAFDSKGNLWVSDSNNNRIVGFAPPFKNGQAAFIVIGQSDLKSGGVQPCSYCLPIAGSINNPRGIIFSNSKLWVADFHNHRVLEHGHPCGSKLKLDFEGFTFPSVCVDTDLSRLKTGQAADLVLGQKDFTSRAFVSPQESMDPFDVVQSPEDYLLVSDTGGDRVLLFLPTNNYCEGLPIDRYECQSWFNELANVYASFLDMIPAPYKNGQRAALVIGQEKLESSPVKAASDTSLKTPTGLALDWKGNLWVSDSDNNRVLKYNRYP